MIFFCRILIQWNFLILSLRLFTIWSIGRFLDVRHGQWMSRKVALVLDAQRIPLEGEFLARGRAQRPKPLHLFQEQGGERVFHFGHGRLRHRDAFPVRRAPGGHRGTHAPAGMRRNLEHHYRQVANNFYRSLSHVCGKISEKCNTQILNLRDPR